MKAFTEDNAVIDSPEDRRLAGAQVTPFGVSVVIPCFNAGRYMRETLASVLAQDCPGPLEVLVADDDSSDGSRQIAESFGSQIRVLPKPPGAKRGAAVARNRCLRSATQPYLAFLDADDLWMPGHLHALAETLTSRPELGLVYDRGYDVDSSGRVLNPRFREPHEPRTTPDKLMLEQCFGTGQVMVRRSVFETVGLFDESLRHCEDHDMWLRILEAFPAAYVPFDGFLYRQHESQKSLKPTLWEDAARVFVRACQRYPYRPETRRKRSAVLAFRFSQIALRERRYLAAASSLGRAIALDMPRAYGEARRLLGRAVLASFVRRHKALQGVTGTGDSAASTGRMID